MHRHAAMPEMRQTVPGVRVHRTVYQRHAPLSAAGARGTAQTSSARRLSSRRKRSWDFVDQAPGCREVTACAIAPESQVSSSAVSAK